MLVISKATSIIEPYIHGHKHSSWFPCRVVISLLGVACAGITMGVATVV